MCLWERKHIEAMKYDYLVVGSGLYGAVFAREAADRGKKVLVIDKRPNVAGNIYTKKVEGIHVHKYGAHIFHTNETKVWKYISSTGLPIPRWQTIVENCIPCPLTCIRLIKCGVW